MLKQVLYTACITPFDATGNYIDYQNLEKLLRMQEKAGNGIVLFGSTGEGLSLSCNERKEILNFVCGLQLKNEIIVGVPSHQLNIALDWLDFCNPLPISGYLMTTPIYTRPGVLGQTRWFETLLDRSIHSAMIYNIPGRAGIRLHSEAVKSLQKHPKFLALKDSSGTIESIVDYKIAAPEIAVYCGDDYMMPPMAIEGAVGLVSIASNAWPIAARKYVQACIEGHKLKNKIWWQACKALLSASNPIPIKALLKDIQYIEHDTVRLPLCQEDLSSRAALLSYHSAIQNWENSHE